MAIGMVAVLLVEGKILSWLRLGVGDVVWANYQVKSYTCTKHKVQFYTWLTSYTCLVFVTSMRLYLASAIQCLSEVHLLGAQNHGLVAALQVVNFISYQVSLFVSLWLIFFCYFHILSSFTFWVTLTHFLLLLSTLHMCIISTKKWPILRLTSFFLLLKACDTSISAYQAIFQRLRLNNHNWRLFIFSEMFQNFYFLLHMPSLHFYL